MAGPYSGGNSESEATWETLKAYQQYMPAFIDMANQAMLPTAQASLATAQATQPGWAALQREEQAGNLASDTALLKGRGGDYASALLNIQKQFDPEFFAGREAINKSFSDIDKAYGTGALSDAEAESASRALNKKNIQSGNFGHSSALNTIQNAVGYTDKLYDRLNRKTANTSAWSSALPGLKVGFDASGIGSKPIGTGLAAYGSTGNQGLSSANGIMNNMFNLGQTSMNKTTPTQNAFNMFSGLVGAVRGGGN